MSRWTTVAPLVALLLAGCLASVAPEDTASPDPSPQRETDTPVPRPARDPPDNASAAAPRIDRNAAEEGPPPGGPRSDEVWYDQWLCVDAETHWCDGAIKRHTFEVGRLYGAMAVRFTVLEPAAVTVNNDILIALTAPDGTRANWTSLSWEGSPYTAGTVVSFQVTDQRTLAQAGTWRVNVWSAHLVASAVNYEARVSFTPHPEYIGSEPPAAPRTVALDATWYTGAGGPVAWQRIGDVLPDGFEPVGYPGDPVLDEPCCTPEGTFAGLVGILVEYEAAWVDDEGLPSGRVAFGLTAVQPSDPHDIGTMRNWAILAVAATDARLVDALQAWGFDASLGSISMEYQPPSGTMDVVSTHGSVESERLSFTVGVPAGQSAILGTFGMNGPPQEIGNWGIRDREAGPALVYELPGHNQRGGPGTLQGHFGALGEVGPIGGIGSAATWFGAVGGSPAENEPGRLVYEVFGADGGNA